MAYTADPSYRRVPRDRLKAIVSRRGDLHGIRGPDMPPLHLVAKTIEDVCDPVRSFWG